MEWDEKRNSLPLLRAQGGWWWQQQKKGREEGVLFRDALPVERAPFYLPFLPYFYLSLSLPPFCADITSTIPIARHLQRENEIRELLRESSVGRTAHFMSMVPTRGQPGISNSRNTFSVTIIIFCQLLLVFCWRFFFCLSVNKLFFFFIQLFAKKYFIAPSCSNTRHRFIIAHWAALPLLIHPSRCQSEFWVANKSMSRRKYSSRNWASQQRQINFLLPPCAPFQVWN